MKMRNSNHLSVKLNDGHFMPVLGLGTSAPMEVLKSKVEEAVQIAIDTRYCHIDSAYFYQNEEEIGQAFQKKFADSTVKRDEIFYTTKLWSTCFRPELVRESLERSLKKLQLSYVDLYLVHFPAAMKVECHPYLNQTKLLEYCKSKDIAMVAYAALGSNRGKEWIKKDNPVLLEDPVLNSIAEKHRRTPAQVALHYQLQRGVLALAKGFNEKRIQENFQVCGGVGAGLGRAHQFLLLQLLEMFSMYVQAELKSLYTLCMQVLCVMVSSFIFSKEENAAAEKNSKQQSDWVPKFSF
ncbi:aldo-keto reductase family 1 member C15-like isoform X2 [Nannospalax galili]|uniref:aldo-keto reductase family 1 member C15-like isoform X2 n=1 Tax=Nannospalax galili TaxID=1026970 RepID=UPI00111BFD04|nr:aldo-keto reductase family 1 member C15-like isoform X2 [Nannospalax galili]